MYNISLAKSVPDTWLIEGAVARIGKNSWLQVFRTAVGLMYSSRSDDDGVTWSAAEPTHVRNPNSKACCSRLAAPLFSSKGCIQPSLLCMWQPPQRLLCQDPENLSEITHLLQNMPRSEGRHISLLSLGSITLTVKRMLQVDLLALQPGVLLLAYNDDSEASRSTLVLALSVNEGRSWHDVVVLEANPRGSFHYPTLMYQEQQVSGALHRMPFSTLS